MHPRELPVEWIDVPGMPAARIAVADLHAAAAVSVAEDVPTTWAEARRDEYRAGRVLAHILLQALDADVPQVARAKDRTPTWPADVAASISHTAGRVFVGGARKVNSACFGLDAEPRGAVTEDVHPVLFVDDEQAAIAEGMDPTTLFCCKEAVYKAVYPKFREYFDFSELAVTADARRFRAQPTGNLRSAADILKGEGHIIDVKDHVLACFVVRG